MEEVVAAGQEATPMRGLQESETKQSPPAVMEVREDPVARAAEVMERAAAAMVGKAATAAQEGTPMPSPQTALQRTRTAGRGGTQARVGMEGTPVPMVLRAMGRAVAPREEVGEATRTTMGLSLMTGPDTEGMTAQVARMVTTYSSCA